VLKKLLILTILCSTSLLAGGDIYTWGYHDMVAESLLGLTMFLEEQDSNLMKIVFSFGLLAMFLSVFKHKTHGMIAFEFTKMMVMLIMIKALFLQASDTSTYRFNVVDRITNQTTTINKVPIAIGETLSLFTAVEDAILKRMEVSFSMPDSNSYRQAGLGFNLAAPMEVFRQKAKNPYLEKSLTAYLEDCKFLGDFQTIQNYNDIFYATDIKAVLAAQNHLLSTHYDPSYPNGQTMDCQDLWSKIEHGVGLDATNTLNQLGNKFGMDSTTFNNKADVAMTTMINSTTNSQGNMEQAILRNTTLESVNKIASSVNIDLTTLVRNKGIAEYAMTNDAIISNLQAHGFVPIMKAMVLVIIITISWILAILSIATLNPSYVKMFFTLNLWLLLWGPLFQVLSYAIDIITVDELSAYGTITAENQIDIFGALGAKVSILSKLVWAVPMLAFAIAKGSEHAMVSFIGGMGQGASAAVSGALQQQTRDAVMGRTSYLNLQTNQEGLVSSRGQEIKDHTMTQDGQVNVEKAGDTIKTTNDGTGNSVSASAKVHATTNGLTATASQQLISQQQETQQRINSYNESAAKAITNQQSNIQSINDNGTITTSDGKTINVGESNAEAFKEASSIAASDASKALEQTLSQDELSKIKTAATSFGWQAGAEMSGGFKLFGNGGTAQLSASLKEDGSLAISAGGKEVHSYGAGSEQALAYQSAYEKSLTHQANDSESVSTSLQSVSAKMEGTTESEAKSKQESLQKAWQDQKSIAESSSLVASMSGSSGVDTLNSALNNWLFSEHNDLFDNETKTLKDAHTREHAAFLAQEKLDSIYNGFNQGEDLATFIKDFSGNKPLEMQNIVDKDDVGASSSGVNVLSPSKFPGLGDVKIQQQQVSSDVQAVTGQANDVDVSKPEHIKDQRQKEAVLRSMDELSNNSNIKIEEAATVGQERVAELDRVTSQSVLAGGAAAFSAGTSGLTSAGYAMFDKLGVTGVEAGAYVKDDLAGDAKQAWSTVNNNYGPPGGSGAPYDYASSETMRNQLSTIQDGLGTTYGALNQDYGPPGGSGNTKTYGPQVSSPLLKKD
jgi:conjugal transfer mating pair stabilization protein TraG